MSAYLKLTDGSRRVVTHQQGVDLFLVQNGLKEPEDEAQADLVFSIERVFMDRHKAPQEYRDMYFHVHEGMMHNGPDNSGLGGK
jgi:hypothetical protein